MRWIGLTGGIGTGKSTVASLLEEEGYRVLSADDISHQVVKKGTKAFDEIVDMFGTTIVGKSGEIDRKKLAAIVFSHPDSLKKLEGVIHPKIQSFVLNEKQKLEKQGVAVAFYDVPLLFEKSLEKDFDEVIVVTSSLDEQKSRLKARNNWSDEEISRRVSAQLPMSEKVLRADHVIENSGSIEELKAAVKELVKNHFQAHE